MNLFRIVDECGLPLEIAAIHLRERGTQVDFAQFCRDASAAGWKRGTIFARVREAATETELFAAVLELLCCSSSAS